MFHLSWKIMPWIWNLQFYFISVSVHGGSYVFFFHFTPLKFSLFLFIMDRITIWWWIIEKREISLSCQSIHQESIFSYIVKTTTCMLYGQSSQFEQYLLYVLFCWRDLVNNCFGWYISFKDFMHPLGWPHGVI